MKSLRALLILLTILQPALVKAQNVPATSAIPEKDRRVDRIQDLNTPRTFPVVTGREAWQARANEIRQNILVSCGLWPMPERGPVQFRIFDRVQRDGYSVEKVLIKTWPGFYLGGNLYRPDGRGSGPFPAILNPHGHWQKGRLADEVNGSIAARCITFARQGMIAFTYDMVGYNDTTQVPHSYASDPTNQLWSVNLMGLQTWNSIRALDFLCALPDSDTNRLACTGESGGGTQTFMLGAIDDRLAVQAPIVMVSHSMQGGCLCENAPGLRVKYSNMEIATVPAPRPQLLVAASGDWTRATPWVEGPAIESIYRLFSARERFAHARFEFPHNYNQTSRETVYGWFAHWLQKNPSTARIPEPPYVKEPDQDLLIWKGRSLPEDAVDESGLSSSWVNYAKGRLAALRPFDKASLAAMKTNLTPIWKHALQLDSGTNKVLVQITKKVDHGGYKESSMTISRPESGDLLPAILFEPARMLVRGTVVLVNPLGRAGGVDPIGVPTGMTQACLDEGMNVILVDLFQTGSLASPDAASRRNPFKNYFTVYNRTDLQERIQDILTTIRAARQLTPGNRVALCGSGAAGWWSMLASPAADAVAVEASGLDPSDDKALLQPEYFSPGLNRFGGYSGALALAAPRPAFIHGANSRLDTTLVAEAFKAADVSRALSLREGRAPDPVVASWIRSQAFK